MAKLTTEQIDAIWDSHGGKWLPKPYRQIAREFARAIEAKVLPEPMDGPGIALFAGLPDPVPASWRTIDVLDLPTMQVNALKRAGCCYVEQLAGLGIDDLLRVKQLGRQSARLVMDRLRSLDGERP